MSAEERSRSGEPRWHETSMEAASPDGRWECARGDFRGWGGYSFSFLVRRTATRGDVRSGVGGIDTGSNDTTTSSDGVSGSADSSSRWIDLSELPIAGASALSGLENLADGVVAGFDECEWFRIESYRQREGWDDSSDASDGLELPSSEDDGDDDDRCSSRGAASQPAPPVVRLSANYESDEWRWDRYVELPDGTANDCDDADELQLAADIARAVRVWLVPPVPRLLPSSQVALWCRRARMLGLYPEGVLQGPMSFGETVLRVLWTNGIPRDVAYFLWRAAVIVRGDWMQRQRRRKVLDR